MTWPIFPTMKCLEDSEILNFILMTNERSVEGQKRSRKTNQEATAVVQTREDSDWSMAVGVEVVSTQIWNISEEPTGLADELDVAGRERDK